MARRLFEQGSDVDPILTHRVGQGLVGNTTKNSTWATILAWLQANLTFPTVPSVLDETIIDIGDWNMDTDFTPAVQPVHGLTLSNIRSIEVYIRADAGAGLPSAVYPIWFAATGSPGDAGGAVSAQTVNIGLSRRAGGAFDAADFSDTSYNRGWIIIRHV